MKKKVMATILAGAFLLSTGYPVFASQADKTKLNIPEVVYDKEKTPHKSFSPKKLDANDSPISITTDTDNWFATVDVYNPLFSNIMAKATSESKYDDGSKWPIDLIYAKVRAYKNDALIASDDDSNTNSSYAGIAVNTDLEGWGVDGYGNHKFEESGYQSWYPETYDDVL